MPASTKPTEGRLAAYQRALQGHDWFYALSDDMRVYRHGREVYGRLCTMRLALDPDAVLWNSIAPPEYKVIRRAPITNPPEKETPK